VGFNTALNGQWEVLSFTSYC